ncbi:MAG: dTDP-4-amino-4,6-dideoxygalactose transaminase [Coriobacteriia bacterium]|nr:dTDP-4-amino-4,6-dideoxygalactose transaminase [Coriobacteriia bacterium]MCL2536786.1 dTDP-4-amino-4,6-dideoxygalactose transaminase [Coriobacteriia bacterium]
MIPFNRPPLLGTEYDFVAQAIAGNKLCGDGPFTKQCTEWLNEYGENGRALLTTSGTHALEMGAMLADIKTGDEVIMPSYTFSSTANAFALRGAKIVFVDIRPDTMNIDESKIEEAITEKTRAIAPVHYAGVGCEMKSIMKIASDHNLFVIEDAAQAMMAKYHGKPLGTYGDIGCYSFHETKNYSMGEGGAIVIQDHELYKRAEIIREKGTDRSQFLRGQVDKYTWVDIGSSYLPSDLNAALLCAQLIDAEKINQNRLESWKSYYEQLKPLSDACFLEMPTIPAECEHNAHMFYIKVRDIGVRSLLISWLKKRGILAVFHYVPLHSAPAGRLLGRFHGVDVHTTRESERILRLPLFYGLSIEDISKVCDAIMSFAKAHPSSAIWVEG